MNDDNKDADTAEPGKLGPAGLLIATFAPGFALLPVGAAVKAFGPMPGGAPISLFFLLEAVVLAAFLYGFTRREGGFSWRRALPWREKINPVYFLILLAAVTAYAIYFRDYFRWPPLMQFAQFIGGFTGGWPPEALSSPAFAWPMEGLSAGAQIGFWLLAIVSMGAASAMQTLYFRGFMLPRMSWMGWPAIFVNTALFAMFHIQSPAFWHMFFIFTLGWGVVTWLSRNVWIAVISHVIFNTYSFAFALYAVAAGGG